MSLALQVCFWAGGSAILGTYAALYHSYTTAYSDLERRQVWAFWYSQQWAWAWGVSGVLSTCAVLYFSSWVLFITPGLSEDPYLGLPYVLFIVSEACYVPLLMLGLREAVIADLWLAAGSAIALGVWSLLFLEGAPVLCALMLWLAVHCAVLDGLIWGYSWYLGWYWNANGRLVQSEADEELLLQSSVAY
jgi:hypothetical protein